MSERPQSSVSVASVSGVAEVNPFDEEIDEADESDLAPPPFAVSEAPAAEDAAPTTPTGLDDDTDPLASILDESTSSAPDEVAGRLELSSEAQSPATPAQSSLTAALQRKGPPVGPTSSPLPLPASATPPRPDVAVAQAFREFGSLFTDSFASLRAKADSEAASQVAQYATERRNLMQMFKLAIKRLIESTAGRGQPVDDRNMLVSQFFVVLELVLKHGNKGRKIVLQPKKELFGPLEALEKYSAEAAATAANVRAIPTVRTALGRGRAWIRLALMGKQLSEFVRALGTTGIVRDWYEPWALLRSEDGHVISGMLMGLNTIDFNLVLKGDNLDNMSDVVDMSLYLREGNHLVHARGEHHDSGITLSASSLTTTTTSSSSLSAASATTTTSPDASSTANASSAEGSSDPTTATDAAAASATSAAAAVASQAHLMSLLDQKTYLEELNRNLQGQLAQANERVEAATRQKTLEESRAQATLTQVEQVRQERDAARDELRKATERFNMRAVSQTQDLNAERDAYKKTSQDLDLMYMMLKKQLDSEIKRRGDLDKEIVSLQERLDKAQEETEQLRLEDTDRQDHVEALRKQLDAVKQLNITLSNDLQASQAAAQKTQSRVDDDREEVERLKLKNQLLQSLLDSNQGNTTRADMARAQTEAERDGLQQRLQEAEQELVDMHTDMLIHQEWRGTMTNDLARLEADKQGLLLRIGDLEGEIATAHEKQQEMDQLRETIQKQQETIADLESQLTQSQMRIEDLNKLKKDIRNQEWVDEKTALDCKRCHQAFSLTRRKHHCRNCGDIFCQDCSDNKMSLPSSAKPVRVCDGCHTLLLNTYSA